MSTFGKQFALILSLSSNHFCMLPEIEGDSYSHAITIHYILIELSVSARTPVQFWENIRYWRCHLGRE